MFINAKMDATCKAVTDACPWCAQGLPFDQPRGTYHITCKNGATILLPCTAIDQRKVLMQTLIGDQEDNTDEE